MDACGENVAVVGVDLCAPQWTAVDQLGAGVRGEVGGGDADGECAVGVVGEEGDRLWVGGVRVGVGRVERGRGQVRLVDGGTEMVAGEMGDGL